MKFKQKSFEKIKRVVAHNTLLAYPDFNKRFEMYIDASDFQLGAVIIQEGEVIYFYEIKLTKLQKSYAVLKKELLIPVGTLKEFRTISLG